MTIQTRILGALGRADRLCDDCLAEVTGVKPRQTINIQARELAKRKALSRAIEDCARCRRTKIVNRLGDQPTSSTPTKPSSLGAPESDRPWYWEGNVQRKIVDFLRTNGYSIQSEADTASRQHGKDIVARSPDGRLLWVTVKGYPDKSKHVQARHWFAGALHDLTRYRDEDEKATLAMGLPGGFTTYEGLIGRHAAVRRFLAYQVYWVAQDGTVTVSHPS